MRVLEIIAGFAIEGPLGGIERFGIELARSLDGSQVEPIVCGLWRYHTSYEDLWLARLAEEGIRAFVAADLDQAHPYRSFVRSWRGSLRELEGKGVDLIHSHCQFGDVLALLLARPLGAKALVRTVHNEREWPKRPLRRLLLTNLLYPLVYRLEIGISQQVADNLDRRLVARLLKRRSICLYNAIDLERFGHRAEKVRAQKRQELGLPLEAPVIGTIGRLTQQKGYDLLLEAMVVLLAEMPEARLLLVGDGELASDLKTLAGRLGIAGAVCFAGPRQDVESLLAAMDLFASSSLWEGLPTVILESMAAGVPVVATDVSGTRELVGDGVTGLLVPPGDAQALARAIRQVLRDGALAGVLVQGARRRVEDFSIAGVAKQHVAVYRDIIAHQ
jgi:glycosyltransferase involved in cell wall biosynthesis